MGDLSAMVPRVSLRQVTIAAVAFGLLVSSGSGSARPQRGEVRGAPADHAARVGAGPGSNADRARLPTGALLDPAGRSSDLGNMPLAIALAPGGDRIVVLLAGWREQGIQVVETATGRVLQTLPLPAAFLGLAFSADGSTLYVAGGNEDVIFRFTWQRGSATPATAAGSIALGTEGEKPHAAEGQKPPAAEGEKAHAEGEKPHAAEGQKPPAAEGEKAHAEGDKPHATEGEKPQINRFPAGLALSPDGRSLYVAENLSDTLAVVDLASGRVTQRLATGPYPYAVVSATDGQVYVSAWGGDIVSVFAPAPAAASGTVSSAALVEAGRIEAGRHPSALLLNTAGTRLFVASASTDRVVVVDTRTRRRVAELSDAPPAGPAEGSTPSALALTAGGRRLLVAESDSNAVAVFDLAAATAGTAEAAGRSTSPSRDRLAGRIPVGWYPTAVLAAGDSLVVANGKGRGAGPNLNGPQVGTKMDPLGYTLGQTNGSLTVLRPVPPPGQLAALTRRVAHANGWAGDGLRKSAAKRTTAGGRSAYPPFRHVVYVIKENRTYDQVFGDLTAGDGDPRLQYFSRREAPNHRALAERFGLFDRFLCSGEVSNQGHQWSTAAYSTDYTEKTTPSYYSNRRGGDDDRGANEPAGGYLWDLARARGLAVRNYGEFGKAFKEDDGTTVYRSTVLSAAPYTSPTYPAWDLSVPDQKRADAWIAELQSYVRRGSMPALEVLHLPNDHTSGAAPGKPTPRAYMADNDLALGRIVEALSRSPFWRDTVVFVLEDDAQNGPDHVDSHRAPLLVISAYGRPGTVHRFANTTDVLATIEEILGLGTLSQFDTFGRPLRGVFAATPDLTPYRALTPEQPLSDTNPAENPAAKQSLLLDFGAPDAADAAELNLILWRALKGEVPYPAPARLSTLDLERGY